MQGDSIVVEPHHRNAAAGIHEIVLPRINESAKHVVTIAGESGSGKSEIAAALSELLEASGLTAVILQQDDYFIHPPKTNDRTRRQDIQWVGPQEVQLDLLDQHLHAFVDNESAIEKPLVIYGEDRIASETLDVKQARVAIAEGTYTSELANVGTRVFIDRDYRDTGKHREQRKRDASELDSFIDQVLLIEHGIISAHKSSADIIVNKDYSVSKAV